MTAEFERMAYFPVWLLADVLEPRSPLEVECEAADPVGAVGQGERVAVARVGVWPGAGECVSGAAAPQVEGARGASEPQTAGGLVAGEGADVGVRAGLVLGAQSLAGRPSCLGCLCEDLAVVALRMDTEVLEHGGGEVIGRGVRVVGQEMTRSPPDFRCTAAEKPCSCP